MRGAAFRWEGKQVELLERKENDKELKETEGSGDGYELQGVYYCCRFVILLLSLHVHVHM